jgi:hypothetical protein
MLLLLQTGLPEMSDCGETRYFTISYYVDVEGMPRGRLFLSALCFCGEDRDIYWDRNKNTVIHLVVWKAVF